ncbi:MULTISPECIES: hypothetical protein [Pseudoalteromonas]|uniref:Uncharacterized protein n=1 Tax=Pseudoalteromonas luteoviolacea (strain 2ta16) TaxID=1353533 RepID=V4J9F0_PSEL2|nr:MULTISPECIES: hypothetical protein [Pseudoalteromonas]ESP91807.1 hypothetical protein PL2TA16_05298 [Pseudoalteromonas luteoviolacea 2ta16]KZN42151.1 hypothetical protein N483_11540 [Pseudoalteromonas luteoviolacea NCIMB 1944]
MKLQKKELKQLSSKDVKVIAGGTSVSKAPPQQMARMMHLQQG